jgi:hypothetical protein
MIAELQCTSETINKRETVYKVSTTLQLSSSDLSVVDIKIQMNQFKGLTLKCTVLDKEISIRGPKDGNFTLITEGRTSIPLTVSVTGRLKSDIVREINYNEISYTELSQKNREKIIGLEGPLSLHFDKYGQIFGDENSQFMRDLLIYYEDSDHGPFIFCTTPPVEPTTTIPRPAPLLDDMERLRQRLVGNFVVPLPPSSTRVELLKKYRDYLNSLLEKTEDEIKYWTGEGTLMNLREMEIDFYRQFRDLNFREIPK